MNDTVEVTVTEEDFRTGVENTKALESGKSACPVCAMATAASRAMGFPVSFGTTAFHYTVERRTYGYYAVNTSEELGRGAFGKVYNAYSVNQKTGELNPIPVAVKTVDVSKFKPAEAEYLAQHYKTHFPQTIGSKVYLVTQRLLGEGLTDTKNLPNPNLSSLT